MPIRRSDYSTQFGFTMIEVLCVIVIIGCLGTSAMGQFIDLRKEARAAALRSNLAALRIEFKNQKQQAMLRCGLAAATNLSEWQRFIFAMLMNDITATSFTNNSGTFPISPPI